MAWHKFQEDELYLRDDVVEECERHIASGAVENTVSARWYLGHISASTSDKLKFKPFGATSFGRCPWNPSVWLTPSDESIWTEQPLPPGPGK